MALTELQVRNARPKDKNYRLSDGHGLYLLITTMGGKLWRWKFRFQKREKLMAFGSFPLVTIAAARKAHFEARQILAQGLDPVDERKKKSARESNAKRVVLNPFRDVATAWFEKWKADKDTRYVQFTEGRLRNDVLIQIGDREINEIEAPEIVKMVCKIEERGASDVARRALQLTNQIFRFGIAHGLCKQNPAAMFRPSDVLKRVKSENFARVNVDELPGLLHKIEYYGGSPVTNFALKLMALCFLRTSELIAGEWAEINFEKRHWDLPKEKMKGRKRPHVVPLPRQAMALLGNLANYSDGRWLFPSERGPDKHMSNNTILGALDRMGFKGKMTGHGFRGTASTVLHELGFQHEHIELQLAHAPENDVAAAYNHALYLKQRSEMMQSWADYLDRALAEGNSSASRRRLKQRAELVAH